jgi:hypothetical protein
MDLVAVSTADPRDLLASKLNFLWYLSLKQKVSSRFRCNRCNRPARQSRRLQDPLGEFPKCSVLRLTSLDLYYLPVLTVCYDSQCAEHGDLQPEGPEYFKVESSSNRRQMKDDDWMMEDDGGR